MCVCSCVVSRRLCGLNLWELGAETDGKQRKSIKKTHSFHELCNDLVDVGSNLPLTSAQT